MRNLIIPSLEGYGKKSAASVVDPAKISPGWNRQFLIITIFTITCIVIIIIYIIIIIIIIISLLMTINKTSTLVPVFPKGKWRETHKNGEYKK